MDDQQPKVLEREYGWLTGLFDGEGAVCLTIRRERGGRIKVQPLMSVSGTNSKDLDRVVDILKRAGLAFHASWYTPKGFTKARTPYKTAWTVLTAGHKRCKRLAHWLAPGLSGKKERVELLIDYTLSRESHPQHNTPLTAGELRMADRMRELNLKGGKAVLPSLGN